MVKIAEVWWLAVPEVLSTFGTYSTADECWLASLGLEAIVIVMRYLFIIQIRYQNGSKIVIINKCTFIIIISILI